MNINAVKAVSYGSMKEYLNGVPTSSIAALAVMYDKVWIISITGVIDSLIALPLIKDGPDRISLQFDDVEDEYDDFGHAKPRVEYYIYFDEKMARNICEFVKRTHENDRENNDLLVVNCHMGISRSGAVSDFVRSVCGIDYNLWKRMNPQLIPNLLVKKLLHCAWEDLCS